MEKKKFKIPEQPRATLVNGNVHVNPQDLSQWKADMDAAHQEFKQMMQGAKDPEEMISRLFAAMK